MNKAACFDSPEERELARSFAKMLSNYTKPCVLYDRRLQCVYSNNDLIKEGTSFLTIASEPISSFTKDIQNINVMIDGMSFCTMLFPVAMMDNDVSMYICIIMDIENVMTLWVKSDASANIRNTAYVLRKEFSEVRASENKLKSIFGDNKDPEQKRIFREIEKHLLNIGAQTETLIFYIQSFLHLRESCIIDVASFTETIVKRCNTILAECGRAVECYCDKTGMLINGNSETAVVSLVNALRDALMYSPKDTSPLLTVYEEKGEDGEYIVFKLTYDCVISGSYGDPSGMDLMGQGSGFGLHIIKSFAKECNGDANLRFEGKKAVLIMKIPAAHPLPTELNAPEFTTYDDGGPDFLEIAMKQVVNFSGDGQQAVTKESK